jgi:hypothetical protein
VHEKPDEVLCYIIPVAPHRARIENVVGDVEHGVEGQGAYQEAFRVILLVVSLCID